jgi:hypothetical protein
MVASSNIVSAIHLLMPYRQDGSMKTLDCYIVFRFPLTDTFHLFFLTCIIITGERQICAVCTYSVPWDLRMSCRMNDDRRVYVDIKGAAGKSSPIMDQCAFEYVGYCRQFG